MAVIAWFFWEMRRKCRKPRCNGAFWCFWRGGFRDWLLYVELRRDAGGAGTLGIMNNMHVPAGLLVNLLSGTNSRTGQRLLQARW